MRSLDFSMVNFWFVAVTILLAVGLMFAAKILEELEKIRGLLDGEDTQDTSGP